MSMDNTHRNTIKISNWNANGIRTRIHEFNDFLNNNFIDVACLQETMLSASDIVPSHSNYVLYRNDRENSTNRASGGVAIKIRRSLRHQLLPSMNLRLIENIGVEVFLDNGERIQIWSVYLPGGSTNDQIRQNLKHDIHMMTNRQCSYFINGDFNSRHRFWNCARANVAGNILYNEHAIRNFFILHPSSHTRFPSNAGRLPSTIDLTLTNGLHETTGLETHSNDSDHTIITYDVILDAQAMQNSPFFMPLFRKANWNRYRSVIQSELGLNLPSEMDGVSNPEQIDDMINNFVRTVTDAQKISVPMIRKQSYSVCLPQNLKDKIRRKNNLRRTSQRYPQFEVFLRYEINQLKFEIDEEIKSLVNENYSHMLSQIDKNDSYVKLWQTTKFLKNRGKQIPALKVEDRTLLTPEEKSNALAHQFNKNHDNPLANNNISHTRHVNTTVNRFLTQNQSQDPNTLFTDESEVKFTISKLKRSKAPGLDKMHNDLMKNLPPNGFTYLTFIMNCCLRLSYFPVNWKKAKVIAIHKPGKPPSSPSSYRPISLLSSISKVFERIILTRLKCHLEENNIIPDHQHGFRQGYSTTTQLRRLIKHIKDGLRDKMSTGMVLCDITKAFDNVWHMGLLYKLIKIETPPYIIKLIKSFLQNREFAVHVQNESSQTYTLKYGVPQGAVLSPILYNVYTYDVPVDPTCTILQFADDTAFFKTSKFAKTIMKSLEKYGKQIQRYFTRWKISVNSTKTQSIFFTKRRTRQIPNRNLNIFGNEIEWEPDSVKYLGVMLDKKLTFRDHTLHVLRKSNTAVKTLYSLLNRKSKLMKDCKILLYKVAIRPIVTYAAPAINLMATFHKNKLQVSQNRLIKMILDLPWRTSTNQIHEETGMEKMTEFMNKLTQDFENRHSVS